MSKLRWDVALMLLTAAGIACSAPAAFGKSEKPNTSFRKLQASRYMPFEPALLALRCPSAKSLSKHGDQFEGGMHLTRAEIVASLPPGPPHGSGIPATAYVCGYRFANINYGEATFYLVEYRTGSLAAFKASGFYREFLYHGKSLFPFAFADGIAFLAVETEAGTNEQLSQLLNTITRVVTGSVGSLHP